MSSSESAALSRAKLAEEFWARHVKPEEPRLRAHLLGRYGFDPEEADEVIQNFRTKILESCNAAPQNEQEIRPWLYGHLRNRVHEWRASRRTHSSTEVGQEPASTDKGIFHLAACRELETDLRLCIEESLHSRERDVLHLRYHEKKTMATVSRDLDVSKTTVFSISSSAITKLRRCLSRKGWTEYDL